MQFTKRRKVKYLYPGKISKDLILASSRRCKVHCACSQAFLTNPRRPLNDWSMVPVRRTMTTGQKRGGKNFRSLRSVAREKIVRGRAAGPARWTLWVVPVRIPGCLVGFARPTPPPRPNHRGVRCAEPVVAAAAATATAASTPTRPK